MTGRSRPQPTELETKTYSVSKLVELVRSGRVRIPSFQRGFRWGDKDRLDLFDSVQRGYPIGTLLLARGEAGASNVALAGYRFQVPAVLDALWVIDGQQRLATLAMALLDDHSGAYRPIYFDLADGSFVLGTRRRAPLRSWVPTPVLASSSALNRWLRDASLTDEWSDDADQIAQRVREYVVPAYLVPYDGHDDTVLTQIFARINQRGRALRSHEVFQALHSSMRGGRGPIDRVHDDLARLGFGEIEPDHIERAAKAVLSADPDGSLEDQLQRSSSQVGPLFDQVYAALAITIEFLASEVGVPERRLLPYGGTLFTLARFFAMFPKPHARTRELLARWFWRGTVSGAHRTDYSADRRNWRAIKDNEHASIRQLLLLQPKIGSGDLPVELGAFRRGTADSNVQILALASLGPRALVPVDEQTERGSQIQVASLIDQIPSQIEGLDDTGNRTIASYVVHPPITVTDLCAEPPPMEALASHLIDAASYSALLQRDYPSFLAVRGDRVLQHLRAFLVERTALDAPDHDRLALDAYGASADDV